MPIIERGLTWIGQSYEDILHQQLHEHTPWLVQPENIREVTERISVAATTWSTTTSLVPLLFLWQRMKHCRLSMSFWTTALR